MSVLETSGQSFMKPGFQATIPQEGSVFTDDLDAAVMNTLVLNSVLSAVSK